ncbi:MAG: RluA family pseudouridine synthase [Candidatus Sericytochromatia bacterium]|nr:RluA family pseudouridine synthase [Candidatus Sericytochromatia bacterium]
MNDEQKSGEYYSFKVDNSQELMRIDFYLLNKIRYATRNKIQKAAKENKVLVNNVPVKQSYRVKPNDNITILINEPKRNKEILPENILLNIIYEDDFLIVIDKPAGMVVHPAFNNYSGTLLNALEYHFNQTNNSKERLVKSGLVHRLDKNTSGLMIIAKEKETLDNLLKQFFYHSIERIYQTLVWGNINLKKGKIITNLEKDSKNKNIKVSITGKQAITNYLVLEDFYNSSLIECKLETGRTHQIRSHLAYIGHPIIFDDLYNNVENNQIFQKINLQVSNTLDRQALHSSSIKFIHPKLKKELFFQSPLPNDIKNTIEYLKSISFDM